MTSYDNRKNKPSQAEQVLSKYSDQAKAEEEKVKKNQVEYELNGKKFIIKKWKHLDTLARIPEFMQIWYGTTLATAYESENRDELNEVDEVGGSGIYALQFLENLQNIDFENYVKQHLDNVFIKGEENPIDLDEDLASPLDVWALFVKVSSVNFLMQLSQTICSTPTMIHLAEQESGI